MNRSAKKVMAMVLCMLMVVGTCIFAGELPKANATAFAKGADVSWVTGMESQGYVWYDKNGVQKDILQILKDDYQINSVRLRVFVNPSNDPASGWCDKVRTVALAKRAKDLGFRIMIDFHYSDTWADPANQSKPAAWANYTFEQLMTATYNYTYEVMSALATEGVYPEWVQVGNETNNGMLWNDGKASTNMMNFAWLINCGYDAVKAVSSSSKVIVHLSNGYDTSLFTWMFNGLTSNGARFDIIGLSLYPTTSNWSTLNSQALTTMNTMVSSYGKEVIICEVGMEYTAASTCKTFIQDIIAKTKLVPDSKGLGVFYWEPEAFPGYNDNYLKGAWNSNGIPTIALEGFLDITSGTNLVTNPGFEANGAATQTPTGWTTWSNGNADADKAESGGYAGTYKLTHWKSSAYQVSTYQTKTGLSNGTYTLKAWVKNSGGQTACQMYAKNFGGTEKNSTLPTTSSWTQITITNIQVTNGQCEIGLWSNAGAGNWCNMDNVEFYKN